MDHLFSLNAEGGPLLCVDAGAAARWKGSEDDATDYGRLCAEIDANPEFSAAVMPIGGVPGVVWEMAGAGTADVFVQPDGVIRVVRGWLADDTANELAGLAAGESISRHEIGEIDIPSGVLAVLWAPESGQGVPQEVDANFRPVRGTAIDDSVFVVKATSNRYLCCDERVEIGDSQARRLTLIPR